MNKHDDSILKRNEHVRKEEFLPNPDLTLLIDQLKKHLEPVQNKINRNFIAPEHPVVLIIGCPRTGGTLLSQMLAGTGNFAFPSNFLNRFAYAPGIGAMIQKMLFDPLYDFRGELADMQLQTQNRFESRLGKTSGTLNISEFFHFWRRFFPNYDPGYLSADDLEKVDIPSMRSELASLVHEFQKPFLSKGKMMQHNLVFFANRMKELFFVHVKRSPRYVMQSVLLSRRTYYGNDHVWFSTKPREYSWLKELDPYHQIAGQVLFTQRSIDDEFTQIDESQRLTVEYEAFCANPQEIYDQIRKIIEHKGSRLPEYATATEFICGNNDKLPAHEVERLLTAYHEMEQRF